MLKKENKNLAAIEADTQSVTIPVSINHPLLKLKSELSWDDITEIMVKHWRKAGKNVDGGPGQPWDTELYVPVVVLIIVKNLPYRQMEAYLSENAPARIFISKDTEPKAHVRDHSNIARGYAALGSEGIEEVNKLVLNFAVKHGFGDSCILSGDTTAVELPIGYPNEPGILKGLAQRCMRAAENLKEKGIETANCVIETAAKVIRSAKEYHLFAKDTEEKQTILKRMVKETKSLLKKTSEIVEIIKEIPGKVIKNAKEKLEVMKEVGEQLIPQITYWMKTGIVAKGKIIHAGITEAKAIVRNKVGKKVEFGLKYLINRIGGGYIFGSLVLGSVGETKMPGLSLSGYQQIFGEESVPELFVFDRGGHSKANIKKLKKAKVKKVGIQPKGNAPWEVSEEDREIVKSERGMMEGVIGTLKTKKYGFNKPKERSLETLRSAGQRSILSFNLNKLMRDLTKSEMNLPK
jgi:hypothetical protein